MTYTNDILIAGAGPVGLLTALCLAREGIPVTVLEAEADIIPSPRALVYHPPTLKVLDELGVLEDARAAGIYKQDYQFREPETGTITPMNSALLEGLTAYPFNLHLGQHVLAGIILRHLTRLPNIDIRWGQRVTAVTQDRHGVTVTAESEQGTQTLRGRWLVGTDGSHSTVRRCLDIPFPGMTWPEHFVATNVYYDFEAYGYARTTFVVDPRHWAIIVKINDARLWRVTYGEFPGIPPEQAGEHVAEHYSHLLPGNEPYQIASMSPYQMHERAADRFRLGRVVLLGDAAHVCNPTGGYGLTGGLLDAAEVGAALAAVIHSQAKEDLLDQRLAERRRIFLELTSPTASENKRRMSEADPEKRKQDRIHFRRLREDPDYQRRVLSFSLQLAGTP